MNEEILARRTKAKKEYGKLFEAISAILFRYDPAEINFDFNRDEYEPEAETILPHLKNCHSAEDVLTVVRKELRKWFGEETAAREENKGIADEIWKLWQTAEMS